MEFDVGFRNPTHEHLPPPFVSAIILACLKTLSMNEAVPCTQMKKGPSFSGENSNAYFVIKFQEDIYKISFSRHFRPIVFQVFTATPSIGAIQIMTNLSKVEQKVCLEPRLLSRFVCIQGETRFPVGAVGERAGRERKPRSFVVAKGKTSGKTAKLFSLHLEIPLESSILQSRPLERVVIGRCGAVFVCCSSSLFCIFMKL